MSTVAAHPLRLLHLVLLLSSYLYRSITSKAASFSPPISPKLPSYRRISLLFPLYQLDTLGSYSQLRISHQESQEGSASGKLEQIHRDQKINSKPWKSRLSFPPRSLQRSSSHNIHLPLFITSTRLFISPSPPKLRQNHSHQLSHNSSSSSLLPESDSLYPIVNAPPIKNGSK